MNYLIKKSLIMKSSNNIQNELILYVAVPMGCKEQERVHLICIQNSFCNGILSFWKWNKPIFRSSKKISNVTLGALRFSESIFVVFRKEVSG